MLVFTPSYPDHLPTMASAKLANADAVTLAYAGAYRSARAAGAARPESIRCALSVRAECARNPEYAAMLADLRTAAAAVIVS